MGCAELAPLSATVAEVRSLVVDEQARGLGFGRLLVDTIADEARLAGFRTVCAFTHDPAYFVRLGYSLVPHAWLPEKIAHDCAGCTLFRRCGQDAVRLQLAERGTARMSVSEITGGITAAEGFTAAGVAAGIKASGALDITLIVADRAGLGRGGLHDQPGAGRAGPGLARARRRQRRLGSRGHRQQRLRQRLHRRPGPGDDARDGGVGRRAGGLPGRAGAGLLHRRHRRAPSGR